MNPQDDPEARIRDLERPLSEVARTSELGAGQYLGGDGSAPPPPPPGYYGTPFPTPPTRGSGGFPWWWLIVGTLTNAPSNRPTVPGDKTQMPSAEPPVDVEASVDVATPGGNVTVSGIGENKTIACNESAINVSGIDNTVVITGHCTSLVESGMDNAVTVDSAESIEASGFDNRVTFKSGSPEIDKSGGGNVVEPG